MDGEKNRYNTDRARTASYVLICPPAAPRPQFYISNSAPATLLMKLERIKLIVHSGGSLSLSLSLSLRVRR